MKGPARIIPVGPCGVCKLRSDTLYFERKCPAFAGRVHRVEYFEADS